MSVYLIYTAEIFYV